MYSLSLLSKTFSSKYKNFRYCRFWKMLNKASSSQKTCKVKYFCFFFLSSRKFISLSSFSLSSSSLLTLSLLSFSPYSLSSLSLSLTLGGACLVHLAPYDPHIQTPDGVFSFFWTLLLSWPNLDASVAAKLWNIMIISEFVCNVQYFIIRWHICQSFNVSSKSNNKEKK